MNKPIKPGELPQGEFSQIDYVNLYITYAPVLVRFIIQFTLNESTARQILDYFIMDILKEATEGEAGELRFVSRLLQVARRYALAVLQKNPDFDEGDCWNEQRNFFPLDDKSLTRQHKEIFCLLYFRGLDESTVSLRLKIPQSEVKQKMTETLRAISAGMIFKL